MPSTNYEFKWVLKMEAKLLKHWSLDRPCTNKFAVKCWRLRQPRTNNKRKVTRQHLPSKSTLKPQQLTKRIPVAMWMWHRHLVSHLPNLTAWRMESWAWEKTNSTSINWPQQRRTRFLNAHFFTRAGKKMAARGRTRTWTVPCRYNHDHPCFPIMESPKKLMLKLEAIRSRRHLRVCRWPLP